MVVKEINIKKRTHGVYLNEDGLFVTTTILRPKNIREQSRRMMRQQFKVVWKNQELYALLGRSLRK